MKTRLSLLLLTLLALAALALPASAAGPAPLGDPVNLQWDPDDPGAVTWETEEPYQGLCRLAFYREGGSSPLWSAQVEHAAGEAGPFRESYFKYQVLAGLDLSSGNYFFTVQNLGDGRLYGDSAEVSSGVYAYQDPGPDTALETPAAGHWDWPAPVWDEGQDPDVDGCLIEYGWSETEAGSPDEIETAGSSAAVRSGERDPFFEELVLGSYGPGWYYFRVRPVSANIEQRRCGEWSDWSQGYEIARDVTSSLQDIYDYAQPDEIRRAVQALDRTELKNALTADVPGTADVLAALENLLDGPAEIQVDPDLAQAFPGDKVSIVGAALNDPDGPDGPVLSIGKPQADHVLDAAYDSTLAVKFSMTLGNTATPHDLAVPVKVTLPVPAGVNPDFLAILHYREDGTCEEVLHTVFQGEDDAWYASFVLTGFSDFTLTETVREEPPVDPPPAEDPAASVTIDGTTTNYATFAEAWKAATDPNVNTHRSDAVITLLKDTTDESAGTGFYLNHGQAVTLNLSGHTLTLSSRSFFLGSGETLTVNGAPEDGGSRGKILLTATEGEPGVLRIGAWGPDEPPANLRVIRCDLESHNGPAIFGGDGNVEISGSTVTARAVVSDLNRRTAVSVHPNSGTAVTLHITGSTLSGQSGLWIGTDVTATVEDSRVLGTGDDSSDYGVRIEGGKLTVKGDSLIEAPLEGAHLTGGTLDLQSGVIRAASGASDWMISGLTVENNTSDDTLPAPEAVLCGTVESGGYGVRAADGTVKIQDGASVTAKSEGVRLEGGRVLISGGSVTATGEGDGNFAYGAGLSAWGGSAEISGGAEITGVTSGISVSEDAAVTVTGGTLRAAGEYGAGLRVDGGSVTLKGGTYVGPGSAVDAGNSQVLVKDLLADGFAYYRPDGSVITSAEMDELGNRLPDITQATVRAGDPGGSGPALKTGPGGAYEAVNVPEGAALYLARYEGGRLTAFQELKALSGTLEGSGKLFLLDGGFRPLCPAARLT